MEPVSEWQAGTVFYTLANGEYHLYKVLAVADDMLYTRVYWPEIVQPTGENFRTFDLRTACDAVAIGDFHNAVAIAQESITDNDELEYATFLRIREGLDNRAKQLTLLIEQADVLSAQTQYAEALAIYTEAMSFSKHDFTLFDKRGACYLMLERFSEAVADFEHSLTSFPEGKTTLYACAKAYHGLRNDRKAIEKLEVLLELDATNENAKELLERLRIV